MISMVTAPLTLLW
ncbi:hypothetical protein LINPERPRIM_LOCUS24912 [Linum perenne]